MNEKVDRVIGLVKHQVYKIDQVNEDQLEKYINAFCNVPGNELNDEERKHALASLQAQFSVRMDRGNFIKDNSEHISWYYDAKKEITNKYWDRYRDYLIIDKKYSTKVLASLDRATDDLMDLLGDPKKHNFNRKGLIIGDVQSGKTSTYIALLNKAADAGYRVIILLTGTIEKLRQQTQSRIDEGFSGLDSSAFEKKSSVHIGVGLHDPSVFAFSMTSTENDFNNNLAKGLAGKLKGLSVPAIFVIKKNKSVIEKLGAWLSAFNAQNDGLIDFPLLLIDDEADNASINTNNPELDPTAINKGIRNLLKSFNRSNYLGFTATPFANIFIDPETEDEMFSEDLYPKDFIYALEAPSNYIGARNIFNVDSIHNRMLKINDDCEQKLPFKHKKSLIVDELPETMLEAIRSFFIANSILDKRNTNLIHRSMLINISRLIAIHEKVYNLVDEYTRDLQREIRNYSKSSDENNSKLLLDLQQTYYKHFDGISSWVEVKNNLFEATTSIITKVISGNHSAQSLNYGDYPNGLRVIVVGGLSLSRGLTLEGLIVSYFYRNSKMYDTLMQMGRWFGYRDGYEDLCQIWMPESAIDWYTYISNATDELRSEVKKMSLVGKTPKDFGLCVRSDVNSLLVTARNKMTSARDFITTVSLNGRVVETPMIHSEEQIIEKNFYTTERFINKIESKGLRAQNSDLNLKNPQYSNVGKEYIIDFLKNFETHNYNYELNTDDIVVMISNDEEPKFQHWDVMIASGSGEDGKIGNVEVKFVKRKFGIKKDIFGIQMSGSNNRLGSPSDAKGGLTVKKAREIEDIERAKQKDLGIEKAFSQNLYFDEGVDRNPLLVIYPIELRNEENDLEKQEIIDKLGKQVIGISIGIPRLENGENTKIKYKITPVKFKELFGISETDEIFDEEDFNV